MWYWFDKEGKMATGTVKISGVRYYFKSSGTLGTGWYKNTDGSYYYFTSNGAVTGWKQLSKKWYYFGEDGIMYSDGSYVIDGKEYSFNASGAMK